MNVDQRLQRAEAARLRRIWDRCASGEGAELPVHKGEPKGLAVMLIKVEVGGDGRGCCCGGPFMSAREREEDAARVAAISEEVKAAPALARARRDAEAYVARGGR